MRREIVLVVSIFWSLFPLMAQENQEVRYIAEVLSKEQEELSEEEIQHFSDLLGRPLKLNLASQSQMMESELFTRYQVASLQDYISKSGQIFSYLELAILDGFNEDFVRKIRPFVSLDRVQELEGKIGHDITARTTLRSSSGDIRYGYASRYKLKRGEYFNTSFAVSRSLDASKVRPDAASVGVRMRFKRAPLKLTVGDFNARFGQGLALWSGSDFSTLTSPSAFYRRASGVTLSSSFTGSEVFTGASAEIETGRFLISTFVAFPGVKKLKSKPGDVGVLPACNVTWLWRYGQVGMTHCMEFKGVGRDDYAYIPTMKTSCDFSACYRGVDVFSEFIYDWVEAAPSGTLGVVFPVGDMLDMAAMMRCNNTEHKFAVSSSMDSRKRISGTLSSEINLYSVPKVPTQDRSMQLKLHTQWQYAFSESLMIKIRATERIRSWGNRFRTDVRTDLLWQSSQLSATLRFNVLNCANTSYLTYLELGHKNDKHALYARAGFFIVDDWEDRIYVYERDAPGCYNSPAFYGRGVWFSCYTSWKLSSKCRLYFRSGYTAYPFMKEKKPGKAELRLQTVFSF